MWTPSASVPVLNTRLNSRMQSGGTLVQTRDVELARAGIPPPRLFKHVIYLLLSECRVFPSPWLRGPIPTRQGLTLSSLRRQRHSMTTKYVYIINIIGSSRWTELHLSTRNHKPEIAMAEIRQVEGYKYLKLICVGRFSKLSKKGVETRSVRMQYPESSPP